MAKLMRGSAGRTKRREGVLEQYGTDLAELLLRQVKTPKDGRLMHLGSPGAVTFAQVMAPSLETGELVLVVYTYDEVEDTRAALAGLGNVEIIDDIDDIDPDEPPYELITCIVPYHLRREYVEKLLLAALRLLSSEGTMLVAGDQRQGFERQMLLMKQVGSTVQTVAQSSHLRIVSATKPITGGLRIR